LSSRTAARAEARKQTHSQQRRQTPTHDPITCHPTQLAGGLGIELCRQLLSKGYDLVLACRSARTCDAAAARLRRALPAVPGAGKDADVDTRLVQLPVDLSSFASVRAAAAALEQRLAGRPLDVLCCNGGNGAAPRPRPALRGPRNTQAVRGAAWGARSAQAAAQLHWLTWHSRVHAFLWAAG
jgi:NAD(P)-dependent dehydrogenase (short-subunit alcohol dehydrogenase family)